MTPGPSSTADGTELMVAAFGYAARGRPVFPVAGKRPRTERGLKDASTDPTVIAGWWARFPDAGVAIRTGAVSGLWVLDVDGEEGRDTLHGLERKHGRLPETARAITGGGNEHYVFEHPGGERRNTAGALGPGLDTRGDGGYIVAPPSPHPSGGQYEWDVAPDECELALPPKWLTEATRPRRNLRPVSQWRELVANGARVGERNARCAQLAGHLLARGVDPFVTAELVEAWDAQRNESRLGREEVARTVASIARREADKWTR